MAESVGVFCLRLDGSRDAVVFPMVVEALVGFNDSALGAFDASVGW